MAANLAKWPSNRGLISKIRPSDGCKGNTVPSTVVRGYDLHKPGGHLGNICWLWAVAVMAPFAGWPAFIGWTEFTWVALVGHLLFGWVAAAVIRWRLG